MNGLFSSFGFGASIYAEDLPCVTMENAVVAANAFKDNLRMEVLGVEVFGSIARYSEGHDLDLILIVDERMYYQFVDVTLTRMQGLRAPQTTSHDHRGPQARLFAAVVVQCRDDQQVERSTGTGAGLAGGRPG